jgi:NADH-quinone oxidoreductase subunit L
MAVSLGIAIFGLLVARFMYITSPETPGRIVQRFSGLHKLVYNKYWIDELYDFLFVNSIVEFSKLIWKKFDEAVIDGAVNGVAAVVRAFGSVLRLLQTGLVKDYALSILVGAIVVIGYLLLR